jgi:hypothetical protein
MPCANAGRAALFLMRAAAYAAFSGSFREAAGTGRYAVSLLFSDGFSRRQAVPTSREKAIAGEVPGRDSISRK